MAEEHITTSLQERTYTLRDFVQHAEILHDEAEAEGGNTSNFIHFTLSGVVPQDHQAVIDVIPNELQPDHGLSVTRDYDSVIGITQDIMVNCPISVYAVSNPREALSSTIHLKYRFQSNYNGMREIEYHKIPNALFGFWGQRYMIHIFFPSLLNDNNHGPKLTEEEQTIYFEKGLRPSIATLTPNQVSDWPPSYASEVFRISKQRGSKAYGTKMVMDWAVRLLVEQMRDHLHRNGVEWAQNFFFIHTIRGTKLSTQHSVSMEAAEIALESFTTEADLLHDALTQGEWWFDVGLEVCSDNRACLQWKTSSHVHMVKDVLGITDAHAQRVTSMGSSQYNRDLASHLATVSGCRIEPGPQAEGLFTARYLQMYATDKTVTYCPDGRYYGKAIMINQAMGPEQPHRFIQDLYNTYVDAAATNPSNARIEVRVPYRFAATVLLDVSGRRLRTSLLSFPKSVWWSFRLYRLQAISDVLAAQQAGPGEFRVKRNALLLTAACTWLINSLHSRPDDASASRDLMRAVLPLTMAAEIDDMALPFPQSRRALVNHMDIDGEEEEESDEENDDDEFEHLFSGRPYIPYGAIFLRRLMLNVPVPRMRTSTAAFLQPKSFKWFFRETEDDIRHKYKKISHLAPRPGRLVRVPNKMRRTPMYVPSTEQEQLFHLAHAGHQLPPPIVDDGSDVEEVVADEDENDGNIDQQITALWKQFLMDLMNKSPNPSARNQEITTSYLKLSKDERLNVTEELFQNVHLSDMWCACQYRIASKDDWMLAVKHLFPLPSHVTGPKVQGYMQSRYYTKWKEICNTADPATVDAIRAAIVAKLMRFKWIPHSTQDKLWNTKRMPPRFKPFPASYTGPAPRILVRCPPTWE